MATRVMPDVSWMPESLAIDLVSQNIRCTNCKGIVQLASFEFYDKTQELRCMTCKQIYGVVGNCQDCTETHTALCNGLCWECRNQPRYTLNRVALIDLANLRLEQLTKKRK